MLSREHGKHLEIRGFSRDNMAYYSLLSTSKYSTQNGHHDNAVGYDPERLGDRKQQKMKIAILAVAMTMLMTGTYTFSKTALVPVWMFLPGKVERMKNAQPFLGLQTTTELDFLADV